MMLSARLTFPLALLLAALLLPITACDGGFTDEEAQARCDQESTARNQGQNGGCMTEDAVSECIAAYVECGEDVLILGTCPTTFSCSSTSEEPAEEE
jgi:hypothetical protein